MYAAAPNSFSLACNIIVKRLDIVIHALVTTIGLWLNNYQETPMNKDQVKGRVEEAKGKVKEVTGKVLDDKGMEVGVVTT